MEKFFFIFFPCLISMEMAAIFDFRALTKVGPVPARYVRHGQMCPQLDVSDKNDKKMQDMSDKARFVRHK